MADPDLTREEMDDVQDVFDLFDFWDGRDGFIDAFKVGDMLRCAGMNPTLSLIKTLGGTTTLGEKQYSFEEFLAIYKQAMKEKEWGTYRDFEEAFKSFDREGQGFISAAEMTHMLSAMADRLEDAQISEIMQLTDIRIDLEGNVKYGDFINLVMAGPPEVK